MTITSVSVKLLYIQIPLVFSFLPYSLNSDLFVCLGSAAPHSMMVKRRCVYSEPTGYSTPVRRISDVTTTQIENPSTRRHDWRPFPVMAGTKLSCCDSHQASLWHSLGDQDLAETRTNFREATSSSRSTCKIQPVSILQPFRIYFQIVT